MHFISFYFHAAKSLTAEERLRAIAVASPKLREEPVSKLEKEWTIRQEFSTIDLAPFLKRVHQKLAELGEARALVVEDPDILGGTAVIRNTRVPVYDVAASVAAGLPMKRYLGGLSWAYRRNGQACRVLCDGQPASGPGRANIRLRPPEL